MFSLSFCFLAPPHGLQDLSSPNQGLNLGLGKVLSPNLWLLLFSHPVVSDSLQPHGLQSHYPSGLPIPLWEFAQGHVHCISDAAQPSHPLMPSSPSALNLSQYWGLFQ